MAGHDLRVQAFRQAVAALLDERRPDRYLIADTTEDGDIEGADEIEGVEWMEQVAREASPLIPTEEVRQILARVMVARIEANAMRRGNRRIREYHLTDAPDLGWLDGLNYPIQVLTRITRPGQRVRIRRERVRLGAATAMDLRRFAAEERRVAAKDFASRNMTCVNAETMADQLEATGSRTWGDHVERAVRPDAAA